MTMTWEQTQQHNKAWEQAVDEFMDKCNRQPQTTQEYSAIALRAEEIRKANQ